MKTWYEQRQEAMRLAISDSDHFWLMTSELSLTDDHWLTARFNLHCASHELIYKEGKWELRVRAK